MSIIPASGGKKTQKTNKVSICQLVLSYRCLPLHWVLLVHHDLSFAVGALQVDGVPHIELYGFFTPVKTQPQKNFALICWI